MEERNRASKKEEIEGINFILKHFYGVEFPRRISTFKSKNTQFTIRTKQEMISAFDESEFLDCRISAFPYLKENVSWAADLVFIDIDKPDFKNELSFKRAFNTTIKKIRNQLNGNPTILFTGAGYPIYQSIEGIVLDNYKQFKQYGNPFDKFLRFC